MLLAMHHMNFENLRRFEKQNGMDMHKSSLVLPIAQSYAREEKKQYQQNVKCEM